MHRFIFIVTFTLIFCAVLPAQNTVFHEDFELPSGSDSITTSSSAPNNHWGLSSFLSANGQYCDSAKATPGDTLTLITNAFSTSGNNYVTLNFDHICKIEILDKAIIEVSTNGGSSWTQLTGSHYTGNSSHFINQNAFNASSYGIQWKNGQIVTPQNSWWKNETFNISALAANSSQVSIRFSLIDINSGTQYENYGWFLDNIKVYASPDELIPPDISLLTPIIQDTITTNSAQQIRAQITDQSGIDSAFIKYRINTLSPDTIGMTRLQADTFSGSIPFPGFGRKISYRVIAHDSASNPNTASSSLQQYFYKYDLKKVYFPSLVESFESGIPSSWTQAITDDIDWSLHSGPTSSSSTGPNSAHHGNQYLYTEASSNNSPDKTAELITPTLNTDTIVKPALSFYYHMFGSNMGELHIDVYNGMNWQKNVWTISGNQQNTTYSPWKKTLVDLTPFSNSSLKIRFRGKTGMSYSSDIAIDYIKVGSKETMQPDAGISQLLNPQNGVNSGMLFPIKVNIKNYGNQNLQSTQIHWKIDSGITQTYNWNGTLYPGTNSQALTLADTILAQGSHHIKIWTSQPNGQSDFNTLNDTISWYFYSCSGPLSGNYSIGGTASDFSSIRDAALALKHCGVSGAVNFSIQPGTYNEQITINHIPGASSQNQVHFYSSTHDSSDVIIQYDAINSKDNHILKLDSTSHLIFSELSFRSNSNNYNRLFIIGDHTHNIELTQCRFWGTQTVTSTSQKDLIHSSAHQADSIEITQNRFINGSGALRLDITGAKEINIKHNLFINQYAFAGWIKGALSPVISHNTINTNSTHNQFTALNLQNINNGFRVNSNQIEAASSLGGNGILVYQCPGNFNFPGRVYNNMILINGTQNVSGNWGGIKHVESTHVSYYYNTVKIAGNNPNLFAFLIDDNSTISDSIIIKNNIFSTENGESIVSFVNTDTSHFQSNFNNFYSYSGQDNFKLNGTLYYSLAEWQLNTTSDVQSQDINPYFISSNNLHVQNNLLNGKGTPISGIQKDIDNDNRDNNAPDPGADEFDPSAYDIAPVYSANPSKGCGLSNNESITVAVKNAGAQPISSFQISYSVNQQNTVNEQVTSSLSPGNTLLYTFNNKADLDVSPYGKDSTFHIQVWTSQTNDTLQMNDTLDLDIISLYQAPAPNVNPLNVFFGDSIQLNPTTSDTLLWFENDTISTPFHTGNQWTTPQLYDTTTYWIEAHSVTPSGISSCGSPRIPVTIHVLDIPQFDAGIAKLQVNKGCALDSEYVHINVYNLGYDTIAQGVEAGFHLKNKPWKTDTLPFPLAPGDTLTFTFPQTAHLFAPANDTVFQLQAYVNFNNDTIFKNDSITDDSVYSFYTPPKPSVADTSILYGHSVKLTYPSPDIIQWYTQDTSTSILTSGQSFNTALIYDTTTYWLDAHAQGTGCKSPKDSVVIKPGNKPAYDAALFAITHPVSGIELGKNEMITLRIWNTGKNPIHNLSATYTVDTNNSVTEIIPDTIAPGDTLLYNFTQKANLYSFKSYNISAEIDFPGDLINTNDILHKSVINSPMPYCQCSADYDGRESVSRVSLSTLDNSSYGIDTSYSDYTHLPSPYLVQGGTYQFIIETGFVAGNTSQKPCWLNVFIDYDHDGSFNTSNELALSTPTYSEDTIKTSLNIPLDSSVAVTRPTRMRVVLNEYGTQTYTGPCNTFIYGETEDYNVRFVRQIKQDAGISAIPKPTYSGMEGSQDSLNVNIQNFGNKVLDSVEIRYSINQGSIQSQLHTDSIVPGNSKKVYLTDITRPAGHTQIKAYTEVPGDSNSVNDTLKKSIFGTPILDGKVSQVYSLATGCGLTQDSVKIEITNEGLDTIQSGFAVKYMSGDNISTLQSDSLFTSLLPGQSINHTFSQPVNLSTTGKDSIFEIKAWSDIPGDNFESNDTSAKTTLSLFTPSAPSISDTTIAYGSSAQLIASSQADVFWFDSSKATISIKKGDTLSTGPLFDSTTYYYEARNQVYGNQIRITEIDESDFVEVMNVSSTPFNASGWQLIISKDDNNINSANSKTWTLGQFQGKEVKYRNDASYSSHYWGSNISWGIGDEIWAILVDDKGVIRDFVASEMSATEIQNLTVSAGGYTGLKPGSQWTGSGISRDFFKGNVSRVVYDTDSPNDWLNSGINSKGSINPNLSKAPNFNASGCISPRDSVHILINYSSQSAGIDSIISNNGCGLGMEPISIRIYNNGSDSIQNGLTASYLINNQASITTETIQQPIASGDTILYTFNQPADLSTGNQTQKHQIKAWINLVNDSYQKDDTTSTEVISRYTPSTPSIPDTTINFGDQLNLAINHPDTLLWFANDTTTTAFHTGNQWTSPNIYAPETYYLEAQSEFMREPLTFTEIGIGYDKFLEVKNMSADSFDATGWRVIISDDFSNINLANPTAWNLAHFQGNQVKYRNEDPTDSLHYFGNDFDWHYANPGWAMIVNDSNKITDMVFWNWSSQAIDSMELQINNQLVVPGKKWYGNGVNSAACANYAIERIHYDHNNSTDWQCSNGSPGVTPNISQSHYGEGCRSNRSSFTIHTQQLPDYDVILDSIIHPESNYFLSNKETVEFQIINNGTLTFDTLLLSYKLNNHPVITDTLIQTVGSGDTIIYTFPQKADLSAFQQHTLKGYISLKGDTFPNNDTLTKLITNKKDYCISKASYDIYENIGFVKYGTLQNSSFGNSQHTDYTHHSAPYIQKGLTYNLTVGLNTPPYFDTCGVKMFMDINKDGVFDSTETFLTGNITDQNNPQVIQGVTIPSSAKSGLTMMRIVLQKTDSMAPSLVSPCGNYNFGETEDYLVNIKPRIKTDAGILKILSPDSLNFQKPTEIQYVIKNFGTDSIYNIPIVYSSNYQLNNTKYHTDTLLPGQTDTSFINVSWKDFGHQEICLETALNNDSNTYNDGICKDIFVDKIATVPYFDSFDSLNLFLKDTARMEKIWEYATPQGTSINSAYSQPRAWITSADTNYSNFTQEYLYTPRFDFSVHSPDSLSFHHYFETQSNHDGGQVQYLNKNNIWKTLGTSGSNQAIHWYNSSFNGITGWSGNSGGWQYSAISLAHLSDLPDTTRFRFYFKSDITNNNGDGWAIDDFTITRSGQDAAMSAIISPADTTYNNLWRDVELIIKNQGSISLDTIPYVYQFNQKLVKDTFVQHIPAGDSAVIQKKDAIQIPGQSFVFKAYTNLLSDGNRLNDTLHKNIHVIKAPYDVGVSEILLPEDTTTQFQATNVKVRIKNYGSKSLDSIPLHYKQGLTSINEFWVGHLPGGDSTLFTFNQSFTASAGSFDICASTKLTADYDTTNDEVCKNIISTGIENQKRNQFAITSIAPNPAKDYVSINLHMPHAGKLAYKLQGLNKLIYQAKTLSLDKGRQSIRINTSNLSTGVYMIHLHFKNKFANQKLIIIK